MARVKRGVNKLKSRKNTLRKTKGYYMGRSSKKRQAKEAIVHAVRHAFQHRRKKKTDFRQLWNVRINAGLDEIESSMSYSQFIKALKDTEIQLDRKTLATIATNYPESFHRIVQKVEQ